MILLHRMPRASARWIRGSLSPICCGAENAHVQFSLWASWRFCERNPAPPRCHYM